MRKVFILSTIYYLLSTVLIGCATVSVVSIPRLKETVLIDGARYIPDQSLCQLYNLERSWDPITKKLILSKDNQELKMMVGSSTVLLNNQVRTMEKEAKFYQGSVAIPQSFAQRTLSPFFRKGYIEGRFLPSKISGLPIKNVIIDAGHGGKDPGAIGRRGLKEKDVVLDIAKRLKRELNAAGINAILTRENDKFVSLTRRARIANAQGANFFVSIHANASRSRWVTGVEVFYLSESIDDNLRSSRAAKDYKLNLQEGYSGKNTRAILCDLILSENRRESKLLADFVCDSLSKHLYQRRRGVKQARFYVLKTYIPAILVEVGFISNPREEKKLRDSSYRDKIARSIAEGITQYNRHFKRTARY